MWLSAGRVGGVCFCMCGCVHKSAAAQGGQERASDPMELEVEMSVRCLNWNGAACVLSPGVQAVSPGSDF